MIHCKELNFDFETIEDLHKALRENKSKILTAKKGAVKLSDGMAFFGGKADATKAGEEPKRLEYGDKIYPVINTTKILDSHMDVHLDGIWNKSVKEQAGKVALIINHEYKVGKIIAYPEDVIPMVKSLDWKDLGRDWSGKTEALIFETTLQDDACDIGFKAYQKRRAVQHSVSMEYVKIDLAVNSGDPDWKAEKATWDKIFPIIVNPEKATKFGYFWAVSEAKIYREGSMVMLGSNEATPALYDLGAEKFTPEEPKPTNVTSERVKEINKLITLIKS